MSQGVSAHPWYMYRISILRCLLSALSVLNGEYPLYLGNLLSVYFAASSKMISMSRITFSNLTILSTITLMLSGQAKIRAYGLLNVGSSFGFRIGKLR